MGYDDAGLLPIEICGPLPTLGSHRDFALCTLPLRTCLAPLPAVSRAHSTRSPASACRSGSRTPCCATGSPGHTTPVSRQFEFLAFSAHFGSCHLCGPLCFLLFLSPFLVLSVLSLSPVCCSCFLAFSGHSFLIYPKCVWRPRLACLACAGLPGLSARVRYFEHSPIHGELWILIGNLRFPRAICWLLGERD